MSPAALALVKKELHHKLYNLRGMELNDKPQPEEPPQDQEHEPPICDTRHKSFRRKGILSTSLQHVHIVDGSGVENVNLNAADREIYIQSHIDESSIALLLVVLLLHCRWLW